MLDILSCFLVVLEFAGPLLAVAFIAVLSAMATD
jgi:hypothetical protein